MRGIRGNKVSMIFQEPMTSLNPCVTIGEQLSEPLVLHRGLTWHGARDRAIEALGRVGIPDPSRRVREYPHQLSGGMRQRAMIAMALVCEPRLLIADEPTTALDVTVQAQILTLLKRLRDETRAAVLLVTHNLGVVAQVCDRVTVMYAGRMIESAPVQPLFAQPAHPYTKGLMRSVPRLRIVGGGAQRLAAIPGSVPNLWEVPSGCPFHPRCRFAAAICEREFPATTEPLPGHTVACYFAARVLEEGAA
jgi:oligopeptide/dipeptide ABC transporter ATP-binding protein